VEKRLGKMDRMNSLDRDVIQGWTVVAITPCAVEVEREGPAQGRRIRAQLPVGMGGLLPAPAP
jgi:hypothetical protein